MSLVAYREKRDFKRTPEPAGKPNKSADSDLSFVVQKHAATRLHYDLRLELDGVFKSWAVPKGPSLDPAERSLAVEVEDHPLDYASFEGVIPQGEYGGGSVLVWDRGVWTPEGDPQRGLAKGKLTFRLEGEKLHGRWTLVRMAGKAAERGKTNWLLIKKHDDAAEPGSSYELVERAGTSILSGRAIDEIVVPTQTSPRRARCRVRPVSGSPIEPALAEIAAARKRPLPAIFKPQLASMVGETPQGDDWLHELKFDGYRLLARCDGGKVTLTTRSGGDWTERFRGIAEAIRELKLDGTILDGEAVVLNSDGVSDFQALQNMMRSGKPCRVHYYVFDAPIALGYDLTRATQIDRKEAVRQLLTDVPPDSVIRYSDHIRGQGDGVIAQACRHQLEGIISKRADAPYEQRRSTNWVKSKCLKRQEFVIGGWTDPSGSRHGFGALLLGHYDRGKLVYCGRVGTGFTSDTLSELHDRLLALHRKTSSFASPPTGAAAQGVHWIEPQLVGEVEFTQWTGDGMLRHPSFKGLREDKAPQAVIREHAAPSPAALATNACHSSSGGCVVAGVRISNPDRVVYPEQGITKLELARYYADIAEWILPYIADRPLSIVRCPQGRTKQCFYQKHANETVPEAIGRVDVQEGSGVTEYVTVRDEAALISLIQIGAMELHPWGSRADRLARPDMLVFDLDPHEDADWQIVLDGAFELRERLHALGLESFPRTTGGKGLHVVAPIARRSSWDVAKRFTRSVAEAMVSDSPDRYVAVSTKAKRVGKVYIDSLRNSRGATAVASYSTRARALAPAATPLAWDELGMKLRPDQYTVRNVRERLASLSHDPWEGFFTVRQSLSKAALRELRL